MKRCLVGVAVVCLISVLSASSGEPALPAGLAGVTGSGPSLPAGLDVAGPSLPEGLGGQALATPAAVKHIGLPLDLAGFWEVRVGRRVAEDAYEDDLSLAETRFQFELDVRGARGGGRLTADVLYDAVPSSLDVDLQRGEGWLDLREANVFLTPFSFADVKLGRQILTWGTGDLLFINDNFPKDWVSFLIGRDVEYLKAPSDALKFSLFSGLGNVDVVYTPQFDHDRYISGERVSYFNPGLGRLAGQDAPVRTDRPDEWFRDDELAARFFRTIRGYELAAYTYFGYWKSPAGQNAEGRATFPRLAVYGASARGPLGPGIANAEVGCYDSRDDGDGSNPFVRNSEWRGLLGYERDLAIIAADLTVGLQYYVEAIQDYSRYRRSLPEGASHPDEEFRHVATVRVTKLLMQQNLELSLFAFYSPSDEDAYLRPGAVYKATDRWRIEAGGNVFLGRDEDSFFGQFENNSNVYAALRCGF